MSPSGRTERGEVKAGQYIHRALGNIVEQQDLVAKVHSSVKMAIPVDRVVKRAHGTLGFFDKGKSPRFGVSCYSFTKCWFSYTWNIVCSCVSLHCGKYVIKVEEMQRRLTRMLPGLEVLSYKIA